MCWIKAYIVDVIRYIKDLITDSNTTVEEEVNEINIGPGQFITVSDSGYTGVITCIDYSMFKLETGNYTMYFDSINDAYNWFVRSIRYMREYDFHIG